MTRTRDALIEEAMPLVPLVARKFRVPAGLNADDLESAGNEALFEAATRYDDSTGVPWKNFAYQGIKQAVQNVIRTHRRHPTATLAPVVEGEELPPPVDTRASDPAAIAAAREVLRSPRVRIAERLPTPEAVADQVTRLRSAMFGAISEADVAAVMGAVVGKAKAGDLKAAKLVTDLLAPGRSGVTVNQQVVAIRTGDLD